MLNARQTDEGDERTGQTATEPAGGRASPSGHNERLESKQQAPASDQRDGANKDRPEPAQLGATDRQQSQAARPAALPADVGSELGLPSQANTNRNNFSDDAGRSLIGANRTSSDETNAANKEALRRTNQNGAGGRDDHDDEQQDERSLFINKPPSEQPEKWRGWPLAGDAKRRIQAGTKRAQLAKQESITERGPISSSAAPTETSKFIGNEHVESGKGKTAVQNRFDASGWKSDQKKAKKNNDNQNSNDNNKEKQAHNNEQVNFCSRMLQIVRARRCLFVPLVILVIYIAAIYCLPFIEINPQIPSKLPAIPFDFQEGPLRPSSASAFKFKHLFKDQIHGPESLAFDSAGNLYMAIEGGFILYAHLNKSSPVRRAYLESASGADAYQWAQSSSHHHHQRQNRAAAASETPELVKIAELNGLRQVGGPRARGQPRADLEPGWRRECQLDEKVYGQQLYEIDKTSGFRSKVRISRCSKPLGIRLNADETKLYVIDTLAGLFQVDLRMAESRPRQAKGQRQVFKLVDFRANNGRLVLPAIQLEDEPEQPAAADEISATAPSGEQQLANNVQQATRLMNVSMKALDDLVIDQSGGHDLLYMTVASQTWPATSFIFDVLEGRPSGLVLRYNTANNQLVVLEPSRVALVRTSALRPRLDMAELRRNETLFAGRSHQPSFLLGAPQMDENDIFDDRPLNFPNGLEITDDRQALLIADTSNKRIVRHYVRGPRRGTSDLWAWTPMFPDNIRRGQDRHQETYWVVGCGRAHTSSGGLLGQDPLELLRTWPALRKFLLKNIYFVGYLVELFGENLLQSNKVQDVGYALRTGSSLCSSGCSGMMIIQYNKHGDIIRSVHSREFPNDLYYYSQVNELVDPDNQEHALYLGSPSYDYLTKLTLPTEAHVKTARADQ